jgi:hypothetical protein
VDIVQLAYTCIVDYGLDYEDLKLILSQSMDVDDVHTHPSVTSVKNFSTLLDLCGLVVRVPGYRSKGSEFDSRLYHIF